MWSPPPLEYQNGDIIGYTVNVTDTETQQFTTQSTNITVSTLKPFTVYFLTVAARTSAGIGPFSSPVSIKTHEDGMYTISLNGYCSYMFLPFFLSWQLRVLHH